VAQCDGCPALASIAGALLRKHERRKLDSKQLKHPACEAIVTKRLQAEGCSSWKEVSREFSAGLGDLLHNPAVRHGNYQCPADAFSMLVQPLSKHSEEINRGDEMAALLECVLLRHLKLPELVTIVAIVFMPRL
jgi:hypothetical protein